MAKPIGPLFSLTAHGQIGKGLIFSKRTSGQLVRQYHKPSVPRNGNQLAQREIIGLLTAQWQCMTSSEKAVYNEQAKQLFFTTGKSLTGFNLFVRLANADLCHVHGLCGFWPFEETSGTIAYDKSGNSHNGTKVGSPVISEGRIGKCLALTTNKYVTYGNIPCTKHLPFSVCLWFKQTERVTNCAIVNKYAPASLNGFNLFFGTNNAYLCAWYIIGNTSRGLFISKQAGVGTVDGFPVVLNNWYHVVVTCSNTGMSMYVNGLLYKSVPWTGAPGVTTESTPLNNGLYASYFKGFVDDFRIYDRFLSAAEVKKQYELLLNNKKSS